MSATSATLIPEDEHLLDERQLLTASEWGRGFYIGEDGNRVLIQRGHNTRVSCFVDELTPDIGNALVASMYHPELMQQFTSYLKMPLVAVIVFRLEKKLPSKVFADRSNPTFATTMYDLVLMDGCCTLFRAIIESANKITPKYDFDHELIPGDILVVKSATVMPLAHEELSRTVRVSLLVRDYCIRGRAKPRVPLYLEAHPELLEPEFGVTETDEKEEPETYIMENRLRHRAFKGLVLQTVYYRCPKKTGSAFILANTDIRGAQALTLSNRCTGRTSSFPYSLVAAKPRPVPRSQPEVWEEEAWEDAPILKCHCVSHYGLGSCVNNWLPLSKAQKGEYVFRFLGIVTLEEPPAYTFDKLPASLKRWIYRWWYGTNVFAFTHPSRNPLPSCLRASLESAYPDPVEEVDNRATGYKRKLFHDADVLVGTWMQNKEPCYSLDSDEQNRVGM